MPVRTIWPYNRVGSPTYRMAMPQRPKTSQVFKKMSHRDFLAPPAEQEARGQTAAAALQGRWVIMQAGIRRRSVAGAGGDREGRGA